VPSARGRRCGARSYVHPFPLHPLDVRDMVTALSRDRTGRRMTCSVQHGKCVRQWRRMGVGVVGQDSARKTVRHGDSAKFTRLLRPLLCRRRRACLLPKWVRTRIHSEGGSISGERTQERRSPRGWKTWIFCPTDAPFYVEQREGRRIKVNMERLEVSVLVRRCAGAALENKVKKLAAARRRAGPICCK
jgi:hypothetical protein